MNTPGLFNYYTYFCSDENKWIYEYSERPPIKCKNNHKIKEDSLLLLKENIHVVQKIKNFNSSFYTTKLDNNLPQTILLNELLKRITLLENIIAKKSEVILID